MIKITRSDIENSPRNLNWKPYRKKPVVVAAVQINDDDFEVETMEGLMKGKKGDFLIEGIKGELYPCDREIFYETYETDEDSPDLDADFCRWLENQDEDYLEKILYRYYKGNGLRVRKQVS